ncbi:MAG: SpoIIE family protein phosphatase [Actinobacteria bacterium]|nr:SpoIIE family protein phosphatase [Actinomycetota bacterium]
MTQPQASKYLGKLLQTIPVGVVTVDSRGAVLACNRTASEILSLYGPEERLLDDEPLGMHVTDLFEDKERLTGVLAESFDGEPRAEVFVRTGADGPRHVQISVRRVPIGTDDGVGILVLQDVTERVEADKTLKRAVLDREFLTQSGAELSKSLDYQTTLATVSRLAVSYLCDWCTVNMVEPNGAITRATVAHVDPDKENLIGELHNSHPHDHGALTNVPRVLRSGEPELYAEIDRQLLEDTATSPEYLRIVTELGMQSCMIVPLIAHGETLGVATLVSSNSDRRYDHADLEIAGELARRAALQLYNARLFQAVDESRAKFANMARILQRSLLPPELPTMPGLDVAALYRPATDTLEVGGDFYDLFETGDGDWGVVMGDVQGHGAAAAATTALARYTLRANAMRLARPVHVLYQVNKALLAHSEDRFLSAAFAKVGLGKGADVTISCAGHPKPMVIRHEGRVESAGGEGMLLGLFAAPDLAEQTIELQPADAIVFYTDGITEAGAPRNMLGEEGFRQVLSRCMGMTAEQICASIDEVLLTWQTEKGHRDDCAVLVLRVTTEAERQSSEVEDRSSLL